MSFYLPRANPPLQIIQYGGPPMPKQTSRRNPTKAPSGVNSPKSNTKLENNENPAPMSDAVEVIGLTCLAGEGGSEVNGSGRGREGDVGSYDDFVCQNEIGGEEYMQIFRKCTGEESPNQPVPSGDISQENTVVIEDSQSSLDTDSGDSYKDDARIQKSDRLGLSIISTLECHGRVSPTDTVAVANSDVVDEAETQWSGATSRGSPSKRPISLLKKNAQGRITAIEDKSSSSSSDTDDGNDDSDNQSAQLTSKRKRLSSIHSSRNGRSRKKPKPSHSGDNLLPNGPSAVQRILRYSKDSSDDSSEDDVHHLKSNRRSSSTDCASSSGKPEWKRNCGTADEDEEYEVEEILGARIDGGKLQYRVEWLKHGDDPEWYDASNFENSPHKLRDFHSLNPTAPGPPEELESWKKRHEEGSDTDDAHA